LALKLEGEQEDMSAIFRAVYGGRTEPLIPSLRRTGNTRVGVVNPGTGFLVPSRAVYDSMYMDGYNVSKWHAMI
jgi:hypothetical protein